MSILIKGVYLPQNEAYLDLVITADGNVCFYDHEGVSVAKAVELPDHGDLIDESEKVDAQYYDDEYWIKTKTVGEVLSEVCEVPPKVIIPAERSKASLCDNCDERNDKGCCVCKYIKERSEE